MTSYNKKNREITTNVINLALLWVKDDITLAEAARQLGTINMTSTYTTLARALKEHIKNGNT